MPKKLVKVPKNTKVRAILDKDLVDQINKSDSSESRVEMLLTQILRELKRLK